MSTLGYATLPVILSMQGISQQVNQGIVTPFAAGGQQAGQRAGAAIAQGLRSQASSVEQASRALAASRDKEADAAGKVRVAEAALSDLRARGITDGARLVRAEEALERARRGASQATERTRDAQRDLARATRDSADATQEASTASDEAGGNMSRLGERAKGAAGEFKNMAIAASGVAGISKVIGDAMNFEVINDKLAASLGASPALAKEYGATTANVYKQAFGDSMDQVAETVGALSNSFKTLGFEGEQSLEGATKMALSFSQVFGTDVNEAVQTASQLVTNGLAKNSTEAFDLMTKSFQQLAPAMRDELPEILNEYGTNFRALGFDGETSFNMLVAAAEKGKFALDKTGDALKEFTIRGSDMSKTSVDAYTAIGLNAEDMSNKIAQGGPLAQEALQATAKGLLGIIDPQERANTAIALFGTPLEDLSVDQIPQFLSALTGSEQAMTGFAGSTDQMMDTVGDNATSKLEAFKRTIEVGLADALNNSLGWISDNKDMLVQLGIVAGVAALALGGISLAQSAIAAGGLLNWVKATTAAIWAQNAAWLANPLGLIVVGIAALVAAFVVLWNKSEGFKNFMLGAWEAIKGAFTAAWEWIKPILAAIGEFIMQDVVPAILWLWHNVIEPAFNAIGAVFDVWWAGAKIVFEAWKIAIGVIVDVVMWLWHNVIEPAFNAIGSVIKFQWENVIKPTFDFLKDGFGAVGDFFGGVGDTIKGVWDRIVSTIAKGVKIVGQLLQKVPSVHIPGTDITVGDGISTMGNVLVSWAEAHGAAAGWTVRGPGTGTSDSVPTLLSNGEEVIRERSASKWRWLLKAINADESWLGQVFAQKLANGGTAGDLSAWDGGGGEANLQPSAILARRLIHKYWPDLAEIGGYRASDPYPDHPSGRALDIMTADVPVGTAINDWLFANKDALALNYTIWQQQYRSVDGQSNLMEDRGSPTQNHMDHVHALFNEADVDVTKIPTGLQAPAGADTSATTSSPAASTDSATSATTAATTATSGESKTRLKTLHELGSDLGGILADGLVETFDIPSFIADPNELLAGDDGSNVRTSDSSSSSSPASTTSSSSPPAAVAPPADARNGLTGSDLYSYDLVKVAKDLGLPEAAAIIGNAVGLVETGLKMYANSTVPESLQYPHDAVGDDGTSVGVLQQQNSWGSVADRMNSPVSARLFYDALKGVGDWQTMAPGDAAQAVQRSAFPDRYAQRIPEATDLVKKTSLFDTGGMLMPGQLSLSLLKKPEPLLPAERWATAERSLSLVEQLASAGGDLGGRGDRGGNTFNAYGYTAGDLVDEWDRRQWARTGGQDGRSW